jgi:hypothetical protein
VAGKSAQAAAASTPMAQREISKRPKSKDDERAWAQHDLLLIRLLGDFF